MARIPVDFSQDTTRIDAPSARRMSDTSARIEGDTGRRIGSAISGAAQQFNTYFKEQDESDMVATRQAVLRMQQEESEKLRSSSDPVEQNQISEKYGKMYNSLVSGNTPLGKPYFRNKSGKDQFQRGFMQDFNTKRQISLKEMNYQTDRKNTFANLNNGIKSQYTGDMYDQSSAEVETREYIGKKVEYGFLTEAEGVAETATALTNLDMERANRKLVGINTEPMIDDGSGRPNPITQQVADYKEYVNGLSHLDDGQKKLYGQKADGLLKEASAATKIYNAERQKQIKDQQEAYEFEQLLGMAEGTVDGSSFMRDKGISLKTRKANLKSYEASRKEEAKLKSDATEAREKAIIVNKQERDGQQIISNILSLETGVKDYGQKKRDLLMQLYNNQSIPDPVKTHYKNILNNGHDVPPDSLGDRKARMDDLRRVLALDDDSKKFFKDKVTSDTKGRWTKFDKERLVIDEVTGEEFFDGVSTIERLQMFNSVFKQYDALLRDGKVVEARDLYNSTKIDLEAKDNDRVFFDDFFGTGANLFNYEEEYK